MMMQLFVLLYIPKRHALYYNWNLEVTDMFCNDLAH